MTLTTSNRHDQIGFRLQTTLATVALNWWPVYTHKLPGFLFELHLGPGAGYVANVLWRRFRFTGITFFAGYKTLGGGAKWLYTRARGLRIGITGNANRVPYGFGS